MNYEERTINLINGVMPGSPLRKSVSGEVDAEVILLDGVAYLFSTDDFSHEDLFREDDPYELGWNIACGAISDIIASGGKPLVYAHSMVIPVDWDAEYIKQFSQGVADVLERYGVSFIGGDIGTADAWRYTASVIGKPLGRQVNRRGCQPGDAIFLTGKVGSGNLSAMAVLFAGTECLKPMFSGIETKLGTQERLAELLSHYATCAMDTSDGVYSALNTIAELNRTGYLIKDLPYHTDGVTAVRAMQLPKLLLFLGECGEYEILFTIAKKDCDALRAELTKLGISATEIGVILADPQDRKVVQGESLYSFAEYDLHARDFAEVRDYLREMIAWVKENRCLTGNAYRGRDDE